MARLVLHIHDLGLGGAERVTLDWLSWLQQAGHEVWLVLGPGGDHDRFFTAPDGIQVLEAPPTRRCRHCPRRSGCVVAFSGSGRIASSASPPARRSIS